MIERPRTVAPKPDAPCCSWWLGLDWDAFSRRAAQELARMQGSRVAAYIDPDAMMRSSIGIRRRQTPRATLDE